MSKPLKVWYSDGVEYRDYRLDNGCIVTVETPHGFHEWLHTTPEGQQYLKEDGS